MYPDPIQIPLLETTIRAPHVPLVAAVILGLWLGPRWIETLEGIDRRRMRTAALFLALAVLVGGRLHFAFNHWDMIQHSFPRALKFWSGGLHAGGAIAALVLAAPLVLRHFAIPVAKFADGVTPIVGVGIAIARLGCFLQGCCFGTVCNLPWCVTFPHDSYIYTFHKSLHVLPAEALRSAPIHPLQLYFAAAGLLLTGLALWLHPRKRYDGQVGLVVLLAFAVSAAVLEFFRADYYPRAYWGPLPQLEWTALGLTAAAAVALAAAERAHRRREKQQR